MASICWAKPEGECYNVILLYEMIYYNVTKCFVSDKPECSRQNGRRLTLPAIFISLTPKQGNFFFSIKNNFASIANNTFWVLYVINSFICLQKMSFLPQFILPAVPLQHTTCSNIATIAFKLYKYYSVPCKYYSYLSLFSSYIFVSYKHFFFLMYA